MSDSPSILSFACTHHVIRLELHTESSNAKPELIFMDQIEEVSPDFVQFKNEQCIQVRFREGRVVLTNSVISIAILFCIHSMSGPFIGPISPPGITHFGILCVCMRVRVRAFTCCELIRMKLV